jgi:uncharacterized SAM-binding protein YcdF (DUF218 family)
MHGKLIRWAAGVSIIFVAIILLTPVTVLLCRPLVMEPALRKTDVVIVLGSGVYPDGSLSDDSLQRIVHGIQLYRQGWGDTLLISGGIPSSHAISPAAAMGRLAIDLGVDTAAVVVEQASASTFENAREVGRLFKIHGWENGLLVTSAPHSLRAMRTFQRQGLEVYPAPVPFYEQYRYSIEGHWHLFSILVYEYLGLVYYWWLNRI